jgi:hypothetical protein
LQFKILINRAKNYLDIFVANKDGNVGGKLSRSRDSDLDKCFPSNFRSVQKKERKTNKQKKEKTASNEKNKSSNESCMKVRFGRFR